MLEDKSRELVLSEKKRISMAVIGYDSIWPEKIKAKYDLWQFCTSDKLFTKLIKYLQDSIGSQGTLIPEKRDIVVEILK